METGYDILFFWVARMMMFGLYFMKEVPFRRVLLHGMVVDETGKKMSKVTGNVIDPLDLVHGATPEKIAPTQDELVKFKKSYPSIAADLDKGTGFPAYGADAVRFTLATYPPSNKRIALAPKRIEGYRHFANKIWNATRLALGHLASFDAKTMKDGAPEAKAFFNRWILAQLGKTIAIANAGIDAFRIDEAANEAYRFFWNDFCDWYLEVTKPIFRDETPEAAETRSVMAHVLETSLRLMHPLMPFLTEELWQRAPRPASRRASIAFGPYPTAKDAIADEAVLRDMEIFKAVTSAARTIRSEHEVEPRADVPLAIRSDSDAARVFLSARLPAIAFLARSASPVVEKTGGARVAGTTVDVVPSPHGPIEVLVGLKGLVKKEDELARIGRGVAKIDKDLAAIEKKLASKGFVDRAPKEVVEETMALKKQLEEARARLEESKKLADEL
jgi:valyl-tRNA synthetase